MKKMATVLDEAGITDVAVPKVFDEFTTRRVLVSEWVDGKKLSECEPDEIADLVEIGEECFLVQLLQAGFFHSDPHPGNLLRPHDQSGARLILIDFGLVAQVQQESMDSMVSAIVHLANKDYAALVDDFIKLEILPQDCNRGKVIPLMDKALSPYVKGGGAKKYEEELKAMYGMDGSMDTTVGGFQAMTQDLLTVLNDIPFSIPPYFALLARAVVTLEGLALSVNPDYGLIISAYPFVARKLLASDRPELQQALQEVLYSGSSLGGVGVVTPTRLASLLNSAAGIVAKKEGQAFVDLDAVPETGISAAEALNYVLSDGASSLRVLLATEAETAADLLLRQALRKSVPLIAAAIPQPPTLPFLPKPPEPLALPLPLLLPQTSVNGEVSAANVRPLLTSGQQALDALAPPLTREEEIYAISLVDLARQSLGEEAAALLNGDLAQSPLAAARTAVPLLELLIEAVEAEGAAAGAGGSDTPVLQLAKQALSLLRALPASLPSLPFGSGASGASGAGGASSVGSADEAAATSELSAAVAALQAKEKAAMQAFLSQVGGGLTTKLDERLLTLQ